MKIAFLLFLLSFTSLWGQEEYPVTWHITTQNTGNNTHKVIFEAYIEKGWVIYGMDSSAEGPVATSFTFEMDKKIVLDGTTLEVTPAVKIFEPLFGTEVLKFSKKAIFLQKVTQLSSSSIIKGNINYMACDGTKCLPPTDVPFLALLK